MPCGLLQLRITGVLRTEHTSVYGVYMRNPLVPVHGVLRILRTLVSNYCIRTHCPGILCQARYVPSATQRNRPLAIVDPHHQDNPTRRMPQRDSIQSTEYITLEYLDHFINFLTQEYTWDESHTNHKNSRRKYEHDPAPRNYLAMRAKPRHHPSFHLERRAASR